jgi:hypothetical protein
MPDTAAAIRAAVGQCFARVARSPGQERKFPVGPASAKKRFSARVAERGRAGVN